MTSDSIATPALAAPTQDLSISSAESSLAVSPAEEIGDAMSQTTTRMSRPKMGSRKSSGSIIVSRGQSTLAEAEDMDEDDVRSMSPRRNSTEVQKLSEDARRDLMEQARLLQTSLQAIVERVETVREEHERLEGGNKFLQSYIGELMQTSRITASVSSKTKKTRNAK